MNDIEKAIAYWKEFKAEIPELKSTYPDAGLDGQEECVDLAISALEHQLTNGWIPVSERLPKKSGWYYTTVRRKDSGERMLGMNEFYVSDFRVLFGHIEVIAWKEEKPYTEVS